VGKVKSLLWEKAQRMKHKRTELMESAALLARQMSPEELRDVAEVLSCYRQTVGTRHSVLELLQRRNNIQQLDLQDIDMLVAIWSNPDAG
jgi:hypothetical protein